MQKEEHEEKQKMKMNFLFLTNLSWLTDKLK